jgi:hypothetical protein
MRYVAREIEGASYELYTGLLILASVNLYNAVWQSPEKARCFTYGKYSPNTFIFRLLFPNFLFPE